MQKLRRRFALALTLALVFAAGGHLFASSCISAYEDTLLSNDNTYRSCLVASWSDWSGVQEKLCGLEHISNSWQAEGAYITCMGGLPKIFG